ncbi:hypothetical protein TVAG_323780 [Trichomonas vaginalis G3]|uniref:SAP domain-containing protein n=1 Tax=Trichomonas vaginalis (strain ATCC PRA-98 / G3) TaxID=412133 RepID=A2F480_TRIV3|nr:hypothetical protein TVAGG3_1028520 [Trichomonas vaginalis G3]EAY00259.1 hypothetical protein TVAG_323780 [Trichomonas vaginalis G3]KAI5492681.1 hypothetical protein TVAGG3_1028520 [Trichomonas vaginalis G3]|eukprot:XP_001313188.1 hypothetical protein [Trichomonas vaginalis G3]
MEEKKENVGPKWEFIEEFPVPCPFKFCNVKCPSTIIINDDNNDMIVRIIEETKKHDNETEKTEVKKYGQLLTTKPIEDLSDIELQVALVSLSLSNRGTRNEKIQRLRNYFQNQE